MTYVNVRDDIIKSMKASFVKAKNGRKIEIKAHAGGFGEKEIERIFQKTPAILTSLLKVQSDDSTDNSSCHFVTWVVYRANNRDLLADGALRLASAVIAFLRDLDIQIISDVGKISAEEVYSAVLDKANVTLWAISYKCELQGVLSSQDGDELEGVFPSLGALEYFDGYDSSLSINDKTDTVIDKVNLEVKDGDPNEADS